MSWRQLPFLAAVVICLGLLAAHIVVPQRTGVLALTQVAEPFIVGVAVVVGLLGLLGRSRWPAVALAVLVVVALGRYGPGWISLPQASSQHFVRVQTWNLLTGSAGTERALTGLTAADADIVGIQELAPAVARAIDAEPAIAANFPHRVLVPERTTLGLGLLSRFPVIEHEYRSNPPVLRVVLLPPTSSEPLTVIVAHPLPPRIGLVGFLPVTLDTARRDEEIALIRQVLDAELDAGRSVILLGDLNVTEREPGYSDIAAGMRDAHLDAGLGPGATWRPLRLASLPLAAIRIDYVLTSTELVATSATVDCSLPSDHCRLTADLTRTE